MANWLELILGKGRRGITDHTLLVVADKVVTRAHVVMETRGSKGSEALSEVLLEVDILGSTVLNQRRLHGILLLNTRTCWSLVLAYSRRQPRLVNHVYLTVALWLWHAARLNDHVLLILFLYKSILARDKRWRLFYHFLIKLLFYFEVVCGVAPHKYIKGCVALAKVHIIIQRRLVVLRWSNRFTGVMHELYLFVCMLTIRHHLVCRIVACIVIRSVAQLALIVCVLGWLLDDPARRFRRPSSLKRWLVLANIHGLHLRNAVLWLDIIIKFGQAHHLVLVLAIDAALVVSLDNHAAIGAQLYANWAFFDWRWVLAPG